jgi:rubrerythrin
LPKVISGKRVSTYIRWINQSRKKHVYKVYTRFQDVLEMALRQEKEAVERYKGLKIKHPALRDLFSFLADEERKHVKVIENKTREFMN